MSLALVKKALELFSDDQDVKNIKGKGKNTKIDSNLKKELKKKKKKKQKTLNSANFQLTSLKTNAFNDRHKFETKDKLENNLVAIKQMTAVNLIDETTVGKIVEHQNKKSKRSAEESTIATSSGSVFTDRDFDEFEKEYLA